MCTGSRLRRCFVEATWAAHRFKFVFEASTAKFGQHPALGGFLLGTCSRVLVEASPVRHGVGHRPVRRQPEAARPSAWRGLNLLGFALMEVREALQAHPNSSSSR